MKNCALPDTGGAGWLSLPIIALCRTQYFTAISSVEEQLSDNVVFPVPAAYPLQGVTLQFLALENSWWGCRVRQSWRFFTAIPSVKEQFRKWGPYPVVPWPRLSGCCNPQAIYSAKETLICLQTYGLAVPSR